MPYDDRDDDDDLDVRKSRKPMPHNYMTESVLVLLFCCQLFGIIAIVHAAQVGTHYSRGDYGKAVEASESAKKWCILGAVLGLPAQIVIIALYVMLETQRF